MLARVGQWQSESPKAGHVDIEYYCYRNTAGFIATSFGSVLLEMRLPSGEPFERMVNIYRNYKLYRYQCGAATMPLSAEDTRSRTNGQLMQIFNKLLLMASCFLLNNIRCS